MVQLSMLKFLFSLLLSVSFFFIFLRVSLGGVDASVLKDPSKIIYQYPCEAPVTYKIGSIDKDFKVTESKFLIDIQTAADLWNKAYDSSVFKHDPQDPKAVSVNLVYDERQGLNTKINKLEGVVGSSEENLKAEIAQYERRAAEFEKKLNAFNAEVKKWNEEGGAPPSEYENLKKQQEELEKEANYLNDTAAKLNISTNKHNQQVGQLNQTIENFNEALQYKPEEGIYDPLQNKIDIYFSNNQKELVHTLAHELGHARGVDHFDNEKAIMFPYTSETLTLTSEDIGGLEAVCKRKSVLQVLQDRISIFVNYFNQRYSLLQ